jgi:putative spermidine/putrescine transport system permease protein
MRLPPYTTLPERTWHYLLRILCGLILLYLALPLLAVIPLSFNAEPYFSYPMPGFSMRWYKAVFASESWRHAAMNSLVIAVSTMILSMSLGTPAAIGLNRSSFRLKAALVGFLISPMIVPVVITAVGIYFFFARLGLVNTYLGLVLAHSALATPFVVIAVTATLAGFDYNLVRAGLSLGASPLTVFFRVTMPIIMPGLITAALFAFITSFDEVVVTFFLAGIEQHTLPREMWKGVREEINPTILAVACLLTIVSVSSLTLLEWTRRRNLRLRGLDD